MLMKNGAEYQGTWLHGKANGFGKYVLADGSSYTGDVILSRYSKFEDN